MPERRVANRAGASMSFEPKILSFLCNWCAYAGADLAGISRFQYPPNTRVIRVMCSGRIDPAFVPRAFLAGFDGVMILGCHPGDCHYLSGNIQAERKMTFLRKLLADEGIGDGRLILDWVSAGEGQRFAALISGFTEQIRSLGPLPVTEETEGTLRAIQASLEGEKIRWMAGKAPELLEKENVYGERTDPNEGQGGAGGDRPGGAAQKPHSSLPGVRTDDGEGDQREARHLPQGSPCPFGFSGGGGEDRIRSVGRKSLPALCEKRMK